MRRHHLKNEGKTEEDSSGPPAGLGEKISGLANSDESVRRRAGPAKVGGEARAFSRLQQDSTHQDDAVDDEQSQKKRVKH